MRRMFSIKFKFFYFTFYTATLEIYLHTLTFTESNPKVHQVRKSWSLPENFPFFFSLIFVLKLVPIIFRTSSSPSGNSWLRLLCWWQRYSSPGVFTQLQPPSLSVVIAVHIMVMVCKTPSVQLLQKLRSILFRLGLFLRTGLRISSVTQLQPRRLRWRNLSEYLVKIWNDISVICAAWERSRTLFPVRKLLMII